MLPDWEMRHYHRFMSMEPKSLHLFLQKLAKRDVPRFYAISSLFIKDDSLSGSVPFEELVKLWRQSELPDAVFAAAAALAPTLPTEEIEYYVQVFHIDVGRVTQELLQLDKIDHIYFLALCYRLLDDESLTIREAVLTLSGQCSERGDKETEEKALAALAIPPLQAAAACALEVVGSSTPSTIQPLFSLAEQGVPEALSALGKLVNSEEDRQKILQLARVYITHSVYALREEALNILLWFSTPVAEEDVLLKTAQIYYDELVFDAIGEVTVQVLPALEKILATTSSESIEYYDVMDAMRRIRLQNSVDVDGSNQ